MWLYNRHIPSTRLQRGPQARIRPDQLLRQRRVLPVVFGLLVSCLRIPCPQEACHRRIIGILCRIHMARTRKRPVTRRSPHPARNTVSPPPAPVIPLQRVLTPLPLRLTTLACLLRRVVAHGHLKTLPATFLPRSPTPRRPTFRCPKPLATLACSVRILDQSNRDHRKDSSTRAVIPAARIPPVFPHPRALVTQVLLPVRILLLRTRVLRHQRPIPTQTRTPIPTRLHRPTPSPVPMVIRSHMHNPTLVLTLRVRYSIATCKRAVVRPPLHRATCMAAPLNPHNSNNYPLHKL